MIARLKIYDNPSTGFSSFTYWGDSYKTVLYLDVQFQRPTIEVFQENNEDQFGNQVVTFESVVERNSFTYLTISPLFSLVKSIPLHSIKELEIIETGETYEVLNVAITDTPIEDSLLGNVTIEVQTKAQTSDNCEQSFNIIPC